MSKIKLVKNKKDKTSSKKKEWPLIVYVGVIGGIFIGYLIGRIGLDAYPHPYHWAAGVVGGILGLLLGWAWYWQRGDMV